jgi:tRNA-dihydrouridine synthase A
MNRKFCVAPMMAKTDSQYRYLARQLTNKAVLFTEMIHTNAILHGNQSKFLDYSEEQSPLVLQLGGNEPEALAKVCLLSNEIDYDEINLNLGCPSPKVKSGNFGAALMAHPELVKDCLSAMTESSNKTISVKIRLGINDENIFESLDKFVSIIAETGVNVFYVHARKAILGKLSPKDNREIPPLNYERVFQLKKDFKDLEIIANGGIKDIIEGKDLFSDLDGIMIGREAYSNPRILGKIDSTFYKSNDMEKPLKEITENMFDYFDTLKSKSEIKRGLIHMHGLYSGLKDARRIRVLLSNFNYFKKAKMEIISLLDNQYSKVA